MTRATVDFGIDLGTTNSAVALFRGASVEVIKNNEGSEYTPSAVWLDAGGSLFVGRLAKERLEDDFDNAFCEFKLQMGTSQDYQFARSNLSMKPEGLSAEVLKSLKGDVRQHIDEDIQAAVITVPAAFELPQCEATKQAAKLAGFAMSPLLQEPVAAATAYGFQDQTDKAFWLVYDFGGGTFDAALIQVRDGMIQVINHKGDNHLGGKLIDWAIVDQLLVPAIVGQLGLSDFRRGNPRWRDAFGKLKLKAEEAKIRCSRAGSARIVIDYLSREQPTRFEFELKKEQVEALAEPLISRSVNTCKALLSEKRLAASNISKVLLVGGPTLMPYLRQRLLDSRDGLGIPLEHSVDPLTVVARGAAIFAATQRLDGVSRPPVAAGQYSVQMDYKPVGFDTEPLVAGRVVCPSSGALSGFAIEFVNTVSRPNWRSGRLQLSDGGFLAQLWADKGVLNTFGIYLYDSKGSQVPTDPASFTYMVGLTPTDPPLIHSLGVALAGNDVEIFLEKGTSLPARKKVVLRTAHELRRGQEGELLRIPVVEGENAKRADRNRLIGLLSVSTRRPLHRDVPNRSEVEVTIDIDVSRLVRTRAYIPILDEDYEDVLPLRRDDPDPTKLRHELRAERQRLETVRERARSAPDPNADAILNRVEREQMLNEVEASLAASEGDRDAADKSEKRLLDLKVAIDDIEDALEWPHLLNQAEEAITSCKGVIEQFAKTQTKQHFLALEREARQAIAIRDPRLLRTKVDDLTTLRYQVLREQPAWWVKLLDELEEMKDQVTDPAQAEQWILHARRAITNNDVPALKTAVRQIVTLLPPSQREVVERGFGSGLQR